MHDHVSGQSFLAKGFRRKVPVETHEREREKKNIHIYIAEKREHREDNRECARVGREEEEGEK